MEVISNKLRQLTLADVVQTGRKLGSGAYGEVVEVRLSGLKCAGKKLHDAFFDQSPLSEQQAIISRFVEECVSLSNLRHPNVVQFIGVCFIKGTQLPMMVMELLPESLSQCLERHPQIPEHMKTSILYDVSLGLLYLHSQTPPLIHRDLTANNVLLTSNMSAKLADLGVARIVNLNPAQLTAHMTPCPGTPAYMPPEALSDRPSYDEKLDVFSFGNLILHVCTQQWPLPAPLLTSDPQNPRILKPLTEVQRRQKYLDLIVKSNPLRALAEHCLHNLTPQRPTTANIVSELEQIHKLSDTSLPEFLEMTVEILTLRRKEQQSEKDKRHFMEEKKHLTEEIKQLNKEKAQFQHEKLALKQQASHAHDINAQLPKVKPSVALVPVKKLEGGEVQAVVEGKPKRAKTTIDDVSTVTQKIQANKKMFQDASPLAKENRESRKIHPSERALSTTASLKKNARRGRIVSWDDEHQVGHQRAKHDQDLQESPGLRSVKRNASLPLATKNQQFLKLYREFNMDNFENRFSFQTDIPPPEKWVPGPKCYPSMCRMTSAANHRRARGAPPPPPHR